MTTKLLILDDAGIKRLLRMPAVVQAFPFMKAAAAKEAAAVPRRGCGGCRGKRRANVSDYEGIRSAIGGLPPAAKIQLKQLLGAEQIRVYFLNTNRQRVKLTF
mgnify:CR=1 FL=1